VKWASLEVVLLGVTAHQVTCRLLFRDLSKIPWNAPYMCTSGIRVVVLFVSLVPSSLISCPAEFLRGLIHTFLPDLKCWLFLWLRDIPCILTTVRVFCTRPFSAECAVDLVEWDKKYEVGVCYNRPSVKCINLCSIASTIATPLIAVLTLISDAQPRGRVKTFHLILLAVIRFGLMMQHTVSMIWHRNRDVHCNEGM
jgi:hypothetical protein